MLLGVEALKRKIAASVGRRECCERESVERVSALSVKLWSKFSTSVEL